MLVSINKKFIYTIVSFFIITSAIFLWAFYLIYNQKNNLEQKQLLEKDKYFLSMLTENAELKKKLDIKVSPKSIQQKKDYIKSTIKAYNSKYATLSEAVKIVLFSSFLFLLAIFLLWVLIKLWIIKPINKLCEASSLIATGNLNVRVKQRGSTLKDELDILIATFNNMLDIMQVNIESINENSVLLQTLIDAVPDAIRVIDKKGNVILANKAYYKLSGMKKNKPHKFYCVFANKKDEKSYTPFELIENSKENKYKMITYWNGQKKSHVAINAAGLLLSKERCVVESIRDLSGDINFSYQQKLSSLGFLATAMAHEMKNNLGAVKLVLETMIKENNSETIRILHKQIVDAIELPESLLSFKETNNKNLYPIECKKTILDVVKLMDYEAKKNGCVIKTSLMDNAYIQARESDFRLVLINLILNAINAARENGCIEVIVKETSQHIKVIVKDNGKGIKKENFDKIFEPFYSDSSKEGSGLGLSIVKSITNDFNAKIKVSSKVGVGSSFELTFKKIKV